MPKTRTLRMTVPPTGDCPPVSSTSWSKTNLRAIIREFLKPREDPQKVLQMDYVLSPVREENKMSHCPFLLNPEQLVIDPSTPREGYCLSSKGWALRFVGHAGRHISQPSEAVTPEGNNLCTLLSAWMCSVLPERFAVSQIFERI